MTTTSFFFFFFFFISLLLLNHMEIEIYSHKFDFSVSFCLCFSSPPFVLSLFFHTLFAFFFTLPFCIQCLKFDPFMALSRIRYFNIDIHMQREYSDLFYFIFFLFALFLFICHSHFTCTPFIDSREGEGEWGTKIYRTKSNRIDE